jgi:hypothetical protein
MNLSQTPSAIKKFCRTPWRFQQTVEIPQGFPAHQEFASAIVAAHGQIKKATVVIDQIVFGTERMTALCPAHAPLPLTKDSSLSATGDEVWGLLAAALMDGPDFVFIPTPKPFVCYADHDQWITFYSNSKSQLNHVIEPLASRGYKLIQDWQREF